MIHTLSSDKERKEQKCSIKQYHFTNHYDVLNMFYLQEQNL